jgi:hypothetical protein
MPKGAKNFNSNYCRKDQLDLPPGPEFELVAATSNAPSTLIATSTHTITATKVAPHTRRRPRRVKIKLKTTSEDTLREDDGRRAKKKITTVESVPPWWRVVKTHE